MIIEAIWASTGNGFVWIPGDSWLSSFKHTAWSDPATIAISVGVGTLGLVLFLAEVIPRRPRVVPFPTETSGSGSWCAAPQRLIWPAVSPPKYPPAPSGPASTPNRGDGLCASRPSAAASTKPALEGAARTEMAALGAPPGSRVRVDTTGANASASAT